MPYYVKLTYDDDTSFPLECPYCHKRNADRFRKISIKERISLFKKMESNHRTIQLPICEECQGKARLYTFFAIIMYCLIVGLIIALFVAEPLQGISWIDRSQYFGVGLLTFFAMIWLKSLHLKRFKVRFATKENYNVVTNHNRYAHSLALRNKTEPVKKLFILRPLK